MDSAVVVVCICVSRRFLCILEPRKPTRPDIFFLEGFAEWILRICFVPTHSSNVVPHAK